MSSQPLTTHNLNFFHLENFHFFMKKLHASQFVLALAQYPIIDSLYLNQSIHEELMNMDK